MGTALSYERHQDIKATGQVRMSVYTININYDAIKSFVAVAFLASVRATDRDKSSARNRNFLLAVLIAILSSTATHT